MSVSISHFFISFAGFFCPLLMLWFLKSIVQQWDLAVCIFLLMLLTPSGFPVIPGLSVLQKISVFCCICSFWVASVLDVLLRDLLLKRVIVEFGLLFLLTFCFLYCLLCFKFGICFLLTLFRCHLNLTIHCLGLSIFLQSVVFSSNEGMCVCFLVFVLSSR